MFSNGKSGPPCQSNNRLLMRRAWIKRHSTWGSVLFCLNKFVLFCFVFWLCWVFVAMCGLSLVAVSGGYSSLRCAGFSLSWLLLLRSTGSRHVGFSSGGTWAQ